jgi:hypothetical protein
MSFPRTTPGVARWARLAIVALIGVLSAAGAQAAAHPDGRSAYKASGDDCGDKRAIFVKTRGRWRCQNLYMARVTLDARDQPNDDREGARINAIEAGEYISISCQVHGFEPNTGKSLGLYDMLPGGEFIPDKYVRTLYTGRIPGAPHCDALPHGKWRPVPR